MAKVHSKSNGKSSYTQKVQTPDISYHDAISAWLILDGLPYAFINLTGEQFERWIRAVVPDGQTDALEYLLESLDPVDLVEFWYIVDRIAQRRIPVPLFETREQAIKAAQQASGVV